LGDREGGIKGKRWGLKISGGKEAVGPGEKQETRKDCTKTGYRGKPKTRTGKFHHD